MKIVRELTDCYFADVKPGTVFVGKENIYMAIKPITENDLGFDFNAVNLETGELTYFSESDFVQLVDAELYVRPVEI